MRQTIIAAAAAFVIGGAVTGAALSQAQPAPPPPPASPSPEAYDGAPADHRMGMDGSMPHHHGWGHRHEMMRAFALIYRQEDRALAPADVQKIAEAFLLWNGNHTWKVTNVAATPEGPIGFTLTTQEGSVIARFTMDPHTARITRVG